MGPYVFPNKECPACGKALFQRKDVRCDSILIGSESISDIDSILKICNRCRTNVRHNIMFLRGEKINTMTYNEMAGSGVLFVNSKTAFAMEYLHLTYLRLLRGRLAPGQEASVLELYHEGDSRLLHKQNTRDYLLHALEALHWQGELPTESFSSISRTLPSTLVDFTKISYSHLRDQSRLLRLTDTSASTELWCPELIRREPL